MNAKHPPELKGYHLRNMKHALLVFMVPAIAGGWSYYRQEVYSADDPLQIVLRWTFMIGVGLYILTILFKAMVSLPRCPKCHRRMKNVRTISISESVLFGFKEEVSWRVVECSSCREEYRIPGL